MLVTDVVMILAVSRIAILAASCVIPRDFRAEWRHGWSSKLCHYAALLRGRGMQRRYVRARVWHHFIGAMRDAGHIFSNTPGILRVRAAVHTPAFCLGLIALGLAVITAASHGLAVTRAMMFPGYPDAKRLVLISEGALLSERGPVPRPLLDFWKRNSRTLAGVAGYQWVSRGTARVTPDFFAVLGARPPSFLLRRIDRWLPSSGQGDFAVLGRLQPGATPAAAQSELRELAFRYLDQPPSPSQQVQVVPLLARIRKPLYAYAVICMVTSALLLAAAGLGMRVDRRRLGRIRGRYWAYFCAKSVSLPLALALVIWEFSRATSFTLTGGATFVAEPFFVWLVILACGAIVWWCLADQRARCRACLRTLQYPVRIGSLGAVLFDHAGTELMCCEGHGSLYLPAVSSDYVQRGGWTALDADIASDPVPR